MSTRTGLNGNAFSAEVLNDIVNGQPIVPVRIGFTGRPIGKTKSFEKRDDGTIIATFDLEQSDLEQLNIFVVPGGLCHVNDVVKAEDGVTVIKKMELTELSLTSFPADEGLTAISAID